MIHEELAQSLSRQVNAELYSSYLYLAMSTHESDRGLKGFANWLYVQAQEELAHAMHMYRYIIERGAKPALQAIDLPPVAWESELDVMRGVRSHEAHVTSLIGDLATQAMERRDHAMYQFMTWFVNEQVEEEANADDLVRKLERIGDDQAMLFQMDAELATRVYVDPFPATAN